MNTCDTDGMPTAIGEETLTYRDGTALLASRTVGSVTTEYAYNDYGELAEMTTTVGGTEILNRVFAYDSLGRIVSVDEAANLEETTYTYDYDLIGQLVGTTASGARNFTNSYAYDENGNRTAVSNGIDTLTAADIDHDADDRLLTYGDTTYTYNDSGQLASSTGPSGTTNYDYGVSGELRSVSLPDGTEIAYSHDALQRRIARTVNGTTTNRWIYADRLNPVAEVDADGNTVTTFVYGTGINVPDYMVRDGATYAFIRDHLGSVRFVVDASSGDVAQQLTYDEYGNVLFDSNPGFQPFGYAGGLYDPATELVRFGARDYDPRIGRWTASDPIGFGGGQANLYVYVANSPIVLTDPTGRAAWFTPAVVAALVGGFANTAAHHDQGSHAMAKAFITGAAGGLATAGAATSAVIGIRMAATQFGKKALARGVFSEWFEVTASSAIGTAVGGGVTKGGNLAMCIDEVDVSVQHDIGEAMLVSGVAGAGGGAIAGAFADDAVNGVLISPAVLGTAETSSAGFSALYSNQGSPYSAVQ